MGRHSGPDARQEMLNNDKKATAIGMGGAAAIALTIDWSRILTDHSQQGLLIGACVMGLLGWVSNRQ